MRASLDPDAKLTERGLQLSREEWIAKFGNDDGFDAMDRNKDGLIDNTEFEAGIRCRWRWALLQAW